MDNKSYSPYDNSGQPVAPTPPQPEALPSRPPIPDPRRLGHSMPVGEQFRTDIGDPSSPVNSAPAGHHPSYDFIMSPGQEKRSGQLPKLPGTGTLVGRLAVAFGALLVLIIGYAIISSALAGPSNVAALEAVGQDQTEMIHISNNATQEPDISTPNLNFASTLNLVLGSSNSQLVAYLGNNGHKIGQSQLNLKISTSTDQSLSSAESIGTFNQAYSQTIATQMRGYMNDLSTAYNLTKGLKGRALLVSQYRQAKLLDTALGS